METTGGHAQEYQATKLDLSEEELRLLLENMVSPFSYYRMIYDADGNPMDYVFLAVNHAFELETGKLSKDLVGKSVFDVYPQTERYWVECFGRVAKSGVAEHITNFAGAFGKWYSVRAYSPKPDHVAITVSDVTQFVTEREALERTTQKLKEQQEENYRLAHEEPITGLPNRTSLYEAISERVDRNHSSFAFALVTPDNLVEILASYGSVLSERIMHVIAQRVAAICAAPDAVYSMTGTDIVVLFSSSCSAVRAQQTLEEIILTIRVPVEIDGTSFTVSATCGVACFPKDSTDRDELITKANLALYDAKSNKIPVSFFSERISRKLLLRTRVRNLMPQALVNHEFELYYQPKLQAYSKQILGFEALLRWHSPDLGELAPLDFIGVAEESRLILPLGAWVLRNACRALKMLNDLYQRNFYMAVNVSGIQLLTPGYYDEVIDAIAEVGIRPGQLELEVTESVLLNQEISAVDTLNSLYDRGVKIALDDFGTGWSSMSLLKDLKISTLKVDKTFVQDPQAAKLTELMVQMGHLLGVEIVAEGVETADQLEFVKKIGCDRVQGYYFAKPMPLDALKSFIQKIGN